MMVNGALGLRNPLWITLQSFSSRWTMVKYDELSANSSRTPFWCCGMWRFFLSRKVCRSLSGLDPMPWHGVPVPVPWSCSWQMTLKPSSAQVELWIGCYGRACVEKTSRDEVGPSCIFFLGGLIHISFFHNDIYTYNIYIYIHIL